MAPRYPSIPEPTLEPTSLRDSILSIKQMLEILTGQRGNKDYAAVMPGEFNSTVDDLNDSKVSKSGDTMTGGLRAPSLQAGDAGGAGALLNIVRQTPGDTKADFYQAGVREWMWGMNSGDATMRLQRDGVTDALTVDVNLEVQWPGAAWTAYTPNLSIPSGNGNAQGYYKRLGKTVAVKVQVNVTLGTVAGPVSCGIPAGMLTANNLTQFLVGRENAIIGHTYVGYLPPNSGVITFYRYDNVSTVAAGYVIQASGVIEIA